MNKIEIKSVVWNFTEHRSGGIVQPVKTNLKEASFHCECGADWSSENDSKVVSATVTGECPDCGAQRNFERPEYASM